MKIFVSRLTFSNFCPLSYLKNCLTNERIKYIVIHNGTEKNGVFYVSECSIYFTNIFGNNYCEKFNSYCGIKNYLTFYQTFGKQMLSKFESGMNPNILKK